MKKEILLGNEAIVQGALEAGVDFVSAYPGTPSSEIGNVFSKIAKDKGIYFEFSTNEKAALEAAIGASFSGLKCLVAMKNFGLNVASDSFLPFCYTGTKGPTVLVVADDPSCWSSGQSEQNTRGYADMAHVPMLEPSNAKEAKDFTKLGFEISEKFNIPVILRITTRVAHQRMPVACAPNQKLKSKNQKLGKFVKNPRQFVTMPPRVLEMKKELLEKINKIRDLAEKTKINKIEKNRASLNSKIGIISSGIAYSHTVEALAWLNLNIPVLKINMFYPLTDKTVKNFIKGFEEVLVVEELEGYLEKEIKRLAKEVNPKLKIYGKDLLPEIGELDQKKVALALAKIKKLKFKDLKAEEKIEVPKRFPKLCPGCPYWLVFATIKKIAPKSTIFGGDIGCYMLAGFPPHNLQDYLFSMGSSIGIAHGIKKATGQKVIAFIGDSTFFHAGIPALINTVFNKSNPLIIVLDNRITAMTGHQPNPGMGATGMGEATEEIKIEDIARACRVKNIKTVDLSDISELENSIKDFMEKEEVSLIVIRKMCAYWAKKIQPVK